MPIFRFPLNRSKKKLSIQKSFELLFENDLGNSLFEKATVNLFKLNFLLFKPAVKYVSFSFGNIFRNIESIWPTGTRGNGKNQKTFLVFVIIRSTSTSLYNSFNINSQFFIPFPASSLSS